MLESEEDLDGFPVLPEEAKFFPFYRFFIACNQSITSDGKLESNQCMSCVLNSQFVLIC